MHIYIVTMKCGSDQWLETVFATDEADAIEQAELRHYDVTAIKVRRATPSCKWSRPKLTPLRPV